MKLVIDQLYFKIVNIFSVSIKFKKQEWKYERTRNVVEQEPQTRHSVPTHSKGVNTNSEKNVLFL